MLLRLYWISIIAVGIAFAAQSACQPLEPKHSTLLWGVTLHGYPVTEETFIRLERESPWGFHWLVFFLQWPEPEKEGVYPWESLDVIWNKGVLPCITWEPFYIADGREKTVLIEELLSGVYDHYLQNFAQGAARWGNPLIIRLAHEMNLKRYHWGGTDESYGPDSPAIYRKMFRYVRGFFDRADAQNVIWAFCPNVESLPNPKFPPFAPWNIAGAYYPGDDVVDLLGMDGYNWGTTQILEKHGWNSSWRTFQNIFEPLFRELTALAPGKPVLVFETASAAAGGDRAEWVAGMILTARDWHLLGLSWFQADKEVDWRLRGEEIDGVKLPKFGESDEAGPKWGINFIRNRSKKVR